MLVFNLQFSQLKFPKICQTTKSPFDNFMYWSSSTTNIDYCAFGIESTSFQKNLGHPVDCYLFNKRVFDMATPQHFDRGRECHPNVISSREMAAVCECIGELRSIFTGSVASEKPHMRENRAWRIRAEPS